MTPIDTTSYRSPNFSSREGADIDMLVLHSGEGTKASDLATLRNDRVPLKQRVSSHYYVDRAGNVYELVDPKYAAWHAGASAWEGRDSIAIMRHSIGIETEHRRGQNWPAVQREALRQLCLMLIERYQIPQKYVVTHHQIAPSRKFDPSDWDDIGAWIASLYAPHPAPDPWSLWGTAYPLPPEQRPWGIPQLWAENARWLKEARSNPMYAVMDEHDGHNRFVVQAFQGGAIWGLDDHYQLIRFPRELP